MRSLGYDEGSEPEGMECQEGDDRSHGRTCVTVAATRLLLNVESTCGNPRQRVLIRLEILVGPTERGEVKGSGEVFSQTEQGSPALVC